MISYPIWLISAIISLSSSLLGPATYSIQPAPELVYEAKFEQKWAIPQEVPPKIRHTLTDLIKCESQGNEKAINPKDRDGTASLGLLQFKPSTLYAWASSSRLISDVEPKEINNLIYDGDFQISVFLAQYGQGKPISWWNQHFPACSKKHNYWL